MNRMNAIGLKSARIFAVRSSGDISMAAQNWGAALN